MITALDDGSALVTGYFRDTATFGSTTLTATDGSDDSFIAKLNADGSWGSAQVTQTSSEYGSIQIDATTGEWVHP